MKDRFEETYCTNCSSSHARLYIGDGDFLCMKCNEVTDYDRNVTGYVKNEIYTYTKGGKYEDS